MSSKMEEVSMKPVCVNLQSNVVFILIFTHPYIVTNLFSTWVWFYLFLSSLTSVTCRKKKDVCYSHIHTLLTGVTHPASTGEPLTSQGTVIKIPHTSFKLGARSYCSIEKESFPGFFQISMVMGWFKGRTPLNSHNHCCASVCPAFFITAWRYILSLYLSGLVCISAVGAGEVNG